jgi:transposase
MLTNSLEKEVCKLENSLAKKVKSEYQKEVTLLKSIPGIGQKTALMLLVLSDGFDEFHSASELCSYAGITPTIKESGTSVKGRARMSKMRTLN